MLYYLYIDFSVSSEMISCINNLVYIVECTVIRPWPLIAHNYTKSAFQYEVLMHRPFASSAFPWVVQRRCTATARYTSVELEAVNVAIGAWTAIHIRNSARFFPLPSSEGNRSTARSRQSFRGLSSWCFAPRRNYRNGSGKGCVRR